MNSLSLTYNGEERFFEDWGIADPRLRLLSRGASSLILPMPGSDPTADGEIPDQGLVVVRMNRTFKTGTGWDVGTIIFQGRRTDLSASARPEADYVTMVISDPWYDLEQIIFQHVWKGWDTVSQSLVDFYFCRLNLFQDISAGPGSPWTYLSVANQIAQIITYARLCGANLQLGTVDPIWNVPIQTATAISCAEAIRICIDLVANSVTWFDYSTVPPTLHIRQRPNCTAITLPYAGGDSFGRDHQTTDVKPLPQLQASEVVLQYEKVSRVNGADNTLFFIDAHPPGSQGRVKGAIVAPINLRGGTQNSTEAKITSVACLCATVGFWTGKLPDLARPEISGLAMVDATINGDAGAHPNGVTITDDNGNPVSLATYPYEFKDGQIAPWMKLGSGPAVTVIPVTIKATVSYDEKKPGSAVVDHSVPAHNISTQTKLTNSPPATYSTSLYYDAGDPVPLGLAHNIFDSLATLQYAGQHTIVEENIHEIISPGRVLNLAGGKAAWATMNAVITDVEIDFTNGTTVVSFGPEKHLAPAELIERLIFWRRRNSDDPNRRNSGS
ncbi:MAG: hypothetical protein JWR69_1741 [Pedosphaera sp.]|nr:hypothetical protein [Pedosphaera sp.]